MFWYVFASLLMFKNMVKNTDLIEKLTSSCYSLLHFWKLMQEKFHISAGCCQHLWMNVQRIKIPRLPTTNNKYVWFLPTSYWVSEYMSAHSVRNGLKDSGDFSFDFLWLVFFFTFYLFWSVLCRFRAFLMIFHPWVLSHHNSWISMRMSQI